MRKSTVALILAALLFVCAAGSASAQLPGFIQSVIDESNLLNGIEQLYAQFDHIMSTIEQVQNTYEQIKHQVDMIKSIKWDELGDAFANMEGNPFDKVMNFRDALQDTIAKVNKNLDLFNNLYDTLTKKTVNFHGKKYTYAGLFGIGENARGVTIFDLPMNIGDYVVEAATKVTEGYTKNLSYAQKEALWERWGLSPRNFAKLAFVQELRSETLNAIVSVGTKEYEEGRMAQLAEDAKIVETMQAAVGDSINGHLQVMTHVLLGFNDMAINLESAVNRIAVLQADEELQEQVTAEIKALETMSRIAKDELNSMRRSKVIPGYHTKNTRSAQGNNFTW